MVELAVEEKVDLHKELRTAVFKALEGCGLNEDVKVWTQIHVNLPTKYFPNGYTEEAIREAIDVLGRGPFKPDVGYTNPILMRMAWRLSRSK